MNIRSFLRCLGSAIVLAAAAPGVHAYDLDKASTCAPGQKWNTDTPVKVRLLADSFFDYLEQRSGGSLADLTSLDRDLKAVIALYNAVPGSRLVLQLDGGLGGDKNLDEADIDDFGDQTIVIGFTRNAHSSSPSAEAWVSSDPDDGCTRTRANILFRKNLDWIFGPPDSLDFPDKEDGRSFYTAAQPDGAGRRGTAISFLGILTHEMGHAVGLNHPDSRYAVMAQGFRTWFRGEAALRTRLLPDDTAGLQALYGTGAPQPLDVSVTSTWFKSAAAKVAKACAAQIAAVDAAALAVSQATGLPVGTPVPDNITKGEHLALFQALEDAESALEDCKDPLNASQVDNCRVSSRADGWVDPSAGTKLCGVNATVSAYAPASRLVCPGTSVQARYTLNNHTTARDVLVKAEAWFTGGTLLNAFDGSALRSPDVRDATVQAAASRLVSQVFRLPASAREGEVYHVFVRGVPHDPATGASLWTSDAEPWNNAAMMNGTIKIDSSACR